MTGRLPGVAAEARDTPGKETKTVGYVYKKLNQSSVIIGHIGIKRHNPDRFALEVMNEILGAGSFSSRLMKEVRERQGLAYWIGSNFNELYDYGPIAAGFQTGSKTTGKAISSALKEIGRMRQEEVSEEELKLAKDSIINSFVFRYASSHSIAAQIMSLEYFGFPGDYLDTYVRNIFLVTKADVLRAAKKYIRPDKLEIMVVGDGKDFDVPLSTFGAVADISIKIPE